MTTICRGGLGYIREWGGIRYFGPGKRRLPGYRVRAISCDCISPRFPPVLRRLIFSIDQFHRTNNSKTHGADNSRYTCKYTFAGTDNISVVHPLMAESFFVKYFLRTRFSINFFYLLEFHCL